MTAAEATAINFPYADAADDTWDADAGQPPRARLEAARPPSHGPSDLLTARRRKRVGTWAHEHIHTLYQLLEYCQYENYVHIRILNMLCKCID